MARQGRYMKHSTRRKVYLPNARALGFGKYEATAGDFILWKDPNSTHEGIGRVIGVLTETDTVDGHNGAGELLVLAIGSTYAFGYERWIAPADVIECHAPEHAGTFLSWLFNATPADMLAYISDHLETRRAATYYPPREE